ncbi:MAG TPA: protein kinase [Longimicrobiales bacterium]|nr:protein kinase [Longimicrobiales bacterium]
MLDLLDATLAERYRVERELGRGGMASVWLARDLRHERLVAIKVLHPQLANAIGAERFLREIRITARLQHPGILTVLDSGVVRGSDGVELPWYAMAYVAGESLRARLEREPFLPVGEALSIAREAAGVLHAAHREGVVHRDVKPENLLLAEGHVYVADFGIARALDATASDRLTGTGLVIGTAEYMSPEQATSEAVDGRADQYALASVLYEMLAGEPPFTGPTPGSVVARRLAGPARPIRPVRASVPAPVDAALLRALQPLPADRFPDTASFARALDKGTAPARWGWRRRLVTGVVAGLLGVGAGVLIWQARDETDPEVVALYERGTRAYAQFTTAGNDEAIEAFSAALVRDSTFAPAWAGLAKAYALAVDRALVSAGAPVDSVLRLAVRAVDRAVAADPASADAWLTLAIVSRSVDQTDLAPALRSVRRSLALDSTSAPAWHMLALSLAETGDLDGALDAWRRSVAYDPSYTHAVAYLALGYYWRHQYDSAAVWADSAVAVGPNNVFARGTSGYVAVAREDHARAVAAFDAMRRLTTGLQGANAHAMAALARAEAGDAAAARSLLARAESLVEPWSPTPLHTALYLAQATAAIGDHDRAIQWLRRYEPAASLHFQLHLRCDPTFAAIDADPRFRALLLTPRPPARRGC